MKTPRTDGVDVGITAEVVTAESYRRMREHARTLERENAALREALTKVYGYISWRVCPDGDDVHHVLARHMEAMREIVSEALKPSHEKRGSE